MPLLNKERYFNAVALYGGVSQQVAWRAIDCDLINIYTVFCGLSNTVGRLMLARYFKRVAALTLCY